MGTGRSLQQHDANDTDEGQEDHTLPYRLRGYGCGYGDEILRVAQTADGGDPRQPESAGTACHDLRLGSDEGHL